MQLAGIPGRGLGLWLYRRLPGFAVLAEATYTLIAHTTARPLTAPEQPPTWVRGTLFHYRFTTPAERAATDDCWVREPLGRYVPPLSLESWESR